MKSLFLAILLYTFVIGHCQHHTYSISPKFQNFNFVDGISNLSVQSIEQDEQGYIWIATARGLNKFDGTTFEHFLYHEDDKHSLYHNQTYSLHKRMSGQLFCSTAKGVNLFDPKLDKMCRIKPNNEWFLDFTDHNGETYGSTSSGGLYVYRPSEMAFERIDKCDSNVVITHLISDKETGIWGTTRDNKILFNYEPVSGVLNKFTLPNNNELFSAGNIIKAKNLLLIVGKQVYAFNLSLGTFINLPKRYKKLNDLKNCSFTFIKEIDNDSYWLGTKNKGLFIYSLGKNTLTHFSKTNSNLRSNHLTTIFKDRDDNIWIGTFDQGIDVAFKQRNNINFDNQLNNLTKDLFVTRIASDSNSNLYIGTRSNGLYIYNKNNSLKHLHKDNSFLKSNNIRSLFIDSKNQFWVGTAECLHKTDLQFKTTTYIELPEPNNGILSLCEQGGRIFAGSSQQGLFSLDYNGRILSHIKRFKNDVVNVIPLGETDVLLSSFPEGVYLFNFNTDTIRNLNRIIPAGHDLSEVATMFLDKDSTLWLGSYNRGLYQYSFKSKKFNHFTEKDGLSNNDVVCIEEDKSGNLWLATSFGISRFNKKDEFINFFQNEGLHNLQHHRNSSVNNKELMLFGGNNGLTFFNPEQVSNIDYNKTPDIVLKSISIQNKTVKVNDETKLLSQVLNDTETIILNNKQNILTITYHAFDYVAADRIKYAYILEGLDTKWNYAGERTLANFSNLPPGTYTFKVKAQNNIGLWSGIKSLKIIVKPSPWKSPLAYSSYLLVIAIIIYISFKLTLRAKLYRNKLEMEQKERVRENEIAQMKMRFFTNISHEIRTPLTLIKGNTDLLSTELNASQRQSNSFIGLQNSTKRLLALVNQLLSFRSLENDALYLKLKNEDLIFITNKLIQPIKSVAVNRGISIRVITDYKQLILPIDEDKYEKIMSNLLSNSLKHARKNGNINIHISPLEKAEYSNYSINTKERSSMSFVKIAVIDDGLGIHSNDLNHIFSRFTQSETDKNKPDYSGTGIGLDFTKRLVELHGSTIIAKSKRNIETEFSFVLSLDAKSYKNEVWIKETTIMKPDSIAKAPEIVRTIKQDDKLPLILVVEDDIELNRFISSSLSKSFRVMSCYNGKEGIDEAQKQLPDIILSDIMMPEIDGLELCKLVRKDKLISHVPIILLTAKTDEESEISGLKYGADDYISKPFNLSILNARINNLVARRKKLQQLYKQGILEEPQESIKNQFELHFIKKIDSIISSEYQSSELNVNYLAETMNMSRTNFYRKFVNIMDVPPKEFIIKYRINKAVGLIKNGENNFGEISYLCGFGKQSNFSAHFKKEKGVSPSEFRKGLFH